MEMIVSSSKRVSNRLQNLSESQTLAMSKKARELTALGHDVINLSLGEPDFSTPDHIVNAAIDALKSNKYTTYTPVGGYPELKEAIIQKFKSENQLDFLPNQILVSTGAKQSIANVILSLINPGDEVLLPAPYWVSYEAIIRLAGGLPVVIPTTIDNDFKVTPLQLEEAITENTRLLIFSSPCNPSGTVMTQEDLAGWAEVLRSHENVVVVADEIYEYINFVKDHYSIGRFEHIADRVVTVNGLSKGFAMTGWRIGYMGGPTWIISACEKMQGQITSGTCSIAQRAAITALTADKSFLKDMNEAYLRRRDLMITGLDKITGIKTNKPQGAFYIFADVRYYFGLKSESFSIQNAQDLCNYLLEKCYVALVPGEAFGDANCMRFVYAVSDERIQEAVDRIEAALSLLHK